MKKAIMLPIQPKWVDMIRTGVKEFEFRPYALEVGAKVYIYESKGKKTRNKNIPTMAYHFGAVGKIFDEFVYDGAGAVVGEFVVEECYDLENDFEQELRYADYGHYSKVKFRGVELDKYDNELWNLFNGDLSEIGYTNQRYAIELSEIKFYDKPIPKEEFISWSKYQKMEKVFEDKDCKHMNLHENNQFHCLNMDLHTYGYHCIDGNTMDVLTIPCIKVTQAPQSRIYVVEKEVE